jgi:hypothetical protein
MHTILHKEKFFRIVHLDVDHSYFARMSCLDLAGGAQIRLEPVGREIVLESARLEGDIILFASESIVKTRSFIQVPSQDTSLNHLKTMLGLKGRKKTVADDDDEGSRSPKRKTSVDDISDEDDVSSEESEEESEGVCDSDS